MNSIRVGLAVLALAAGQALAQDSKSDNPLAGPPVKQARPPMFEEGMGAKEGKDRMAEQGIPPREFARIIDKLKGDDVAPSLRLTEEQSQKVQAIEDDFRRQVREFEQKARAEEQKQRAAQSEAQKDGDKPADGANAQARRQNARLQELRRNGPKPAEPQARIWAVLSEPQQKFVQGEVEKVRKDMDAKRSDEYMQRELQKRKAKEGKGKDGDAATSAGPARPLGAPGGPGADSAPRERFRRIVEKLQQLPPEEREEVLRKLEADLEKRVPGDAPAPLNRPGKAGQKGRGGAGGEDKPAPGIDDVKVPSPKENGKP
jgi:hypothetical protein